MPPQDQISPDLRMLLMTGALGRRKPTVPEYGQMLANMPIADLALAQIAAMPNVTEYSIGLEVNGKHFNVPSIDPLTGKALTVDEAFEQGKRLGLFSPELGFDTPEEANAVAAARSKQFNVFSGQKFPLPSGVPSRFDLLMEGAVPMVQPTPYPGTVLGGGMRNGPPGGAR